MFGLSKLTAAVNHLAANLTALAETVGQVNAGVRGRLGLDSGEPALGLPAPSHQRPQKAADGPGAAPGSFAPPRGRRKAPEAS
jgi:hypothetical protein